MDAMVRSRANCSGMCDLTKTVAVTVQIPMNAPQTRAVPTGT